MMKRLFLAAAILAASLTGYAQTQSLNNDSTKIGKNSTSATLLNGRVWMKGLTVKTLNTTTDSALLMQGGKLFKSALSNIPTVSDLALKYDKTGGLINGVANSTVVINAVNNSNITFQNSLSDYGYIGSGQVDGGEANDLGIRAGNDLRLQAGGGKKIIAQNQLQAPQFSTEGYNNNFDGAVYARLFAGFFQSGDFVGALSTSTNAYNVPPVPNQLTIIGPAGNMLFSANDPDYNTAVFAKFESKDFFLKRDGSFKRVLVEGDALPITGGTVTSDLAVTGNFQVTNTNTGNLRVGSDLVALRYGDYPTSSTAQVQASAEGDGTALISLFTATAADSPTGNGTQRGISFHAEGNGGINIVDAVSNRGLTSGTLFTPVDDYDYLQRGNSDLRYLKLTGGTVTNDINLNGDLIVANDKFYKGKKADGTIGYTMGISSDDNIYFGDIINNINTSVRVVGNSQSIVLDNTGMALNSASIKMPSLPGVDDTYEFIVSQANGLRKLSGSPFVNLQSGTPTNQTGSLGVTGLIGAGGGILMDNDKFYKSKNFAGNEVYISGLSNSNDLYFGDIFSSTNTNDTYLYGAGSLRISFPNAGDVEIKTNTKVEGNLNVGQHEYRFLDKSDNTKEWAIYADADLMRIKTSAGPAPISITSTGDVYTSGKFDATTEVVSAKFKLSALNTAPASATDTGTTGEIRVTTGYIYVCVASNTWVRTELTTW